MDYPKKRSEFYEWIKTRNNEIQSYRELRKNSYPLIQDQLDMLWHDIDNELIPGKDGKFYNAIASIKNKIPKPSYDIEEYHNFDFSQVELED
jgi:hypothetical protein